MVSYRALKGIWLFTAQLPLLRTLKKKSLMKTARKEKKFWSPANAFNLDHLKIGKLFHSDSPLINFYTKPQILDSSKLKEFAEDNVKFDENGKGYKTLWEKEKLFIVSNFFFSHSVFKRLVLQTCNKNGLFGKGYFYTKQQIFSLVLLESICRPQTKCIQESIFTNYFKNSFLSFSPRFCNFESNIISDWLLHAVHPILSCVTFKCF